MAKQVGSLPSTLKYTIAATGSLAVTLTGTMPGRAASNNHPNTDLAKWSDAFNTWSVGAGAGFGLFRDPANIDTFNTYASAESPTLKGNGPFETFEVGRDFRANNYVFGLYGDAQFGESAGSFVSSQSYGPSAKIALDLGATASARAGYLVQPNMLFYGLFGWSWQHYDATINGVTSIGAPLTGSGSGTLNGPTFGVGLETLFPNDPNVSLKTEYRYTRFSAPGAISPNGGVNYARFGDVDDQQLRLVLSFKLPQ